MSPERRKQVQNMIVKDLLAHEDARNKRKQDVADQNRFLDQQIFEIQNKRQKITVGLTPVDLTQTRKHKRSHKSHKRSHKKSHKKSHK
jgi:hypothetical protein